MKKMSMIFKNRTLKILLFFLVIFAAQALLLVVLLLRAEVGYAQRAGGRGGENPADCVCAPNDLVKEYKVEGGLKESQRLFIPIPGITDSCGWVCDVNGDQKGNLVDYVVTGYKFLVGLAAVVAVMMIIYGGYSWIFAMGNSSKIEGARETIVSAIIGLVLALVSVQLLAVINPRLIDVALPELKQIARQAGGELFCGAEDIILADNDMKGQLTVAMERLVAGESELGQYDLSKRDIPRMPPGPVKLLWGDQVDEYLRCDNEQEFKVARVWLSGNKAVSIDCFFGLCDPALNRQPETTLTVMPIENITAAEARVEGNKKVITDFIKARYTVDEGVVIRSSTSLALGENGAGCFGWECNLVGTDYKDFPICAVADNVQKPFPVQCVSTRAACESKKKEECGAFGNYLNSLPDNPYNQFGCVPSYSERSWLSKLWTQDMGKGAWIGAGIGFLGLLALSITALPVAAAVILGTSMIGGGLALINAPEGGINCDFGSTLHCPVGWVQVDPLSVPESVPEDKGRCWSEEGKGNEKQRVPVVEKDSKKRAVLNVGARGVSESQWAICCQKAGTDEYQVKYKLYPPKSETDVVLIEDSKYSENDNRVECATPEDCTSLTIKDIGGFDCIPTDTVTKECVPKAGGQYCWVFGTAADDASDTDGYFYYKTRAACVSQAATIHKNIWSEFETVENKTGCARALVPATIECNNRVMWTGGAPLTDEKIAEVRAPAQKAGTTARVESTANRLKKGEIDTVIKQVVDELDFEGTLRGQQIRNGENIDPVAFVSAIIDIETGGNSGTPPSRKGACGLMQILPAEGPCTNATDTKDYNGNNDVIERVDLMSPYINISSGVRYLQKLFVNPCIADNAEKTTACEYARDNPSSEQHRKLYRYVLAKYNGKDPTQLSGGPGGCKSVAGLDITCCSDKHNCYKLSQGHYDRKCFITVSSTQTNIMPTKVECPRGGGDYKIQTYPYVVGEKSVESRYEAFLKL